jgi:hypothetical protein
MITKSIPSSVPFCDPSSPFHDGQIFSLLPHRACRLAHPQLQNLHFSCRWNGTQASSSPSIISDESLSTPPREANDPQETWVPSETPSKNPISVQVPGSRFIGPKTTGSPVLKRQHLNAKTPSVNISQRNLSHHTRKASAPPKLQGYKGHNIELKGRKTRQISTTVFSSGKPLPAPPIHESTIEPSPKSEKVTARAQSPRRPAIHTSIINTYSTPKRQVYHHPRTPAPLLLVPYSPTGSLATADLSRDAATPDSANPRRWQYTPQVSIFEDDDDDERIGLMDYLKWPARLRHKSGTSSKGKLEKVAIKRLKDFRKFFCWPCGRS